MPTSKACWLEMLEQAIERLRSTDRGVRVALVGIGHELRGDDAVGVVAARALRRLLPGSDRLLVLDAGPAPENYTGSLRRFAPGLVLLIDAAQMDTPPGTVRWLSWQSAAGLSATTHSLPCSMLASYLVAELGCEVGILGIQPAGTAVGGRLTPAVQHALDSLVQRLAALLR